MDRKHTRKHRTSPLSLLALAGLVALLIPPRPALAADTWTDESAYSPSPRADHAMVSLGGDQMLVFGGMDWAGAGDTWVYDAGDSTWTQQTPATGPAPRWAHAMAPLGGDQVLLFGGDTTYGSPPSGETWVYDLSDDTWTLKTPAASPPARSGHAMVYLGGDQVLLFGGVRSSTPYSDTWVYDLGDNTWTNMAPASHPSAREHHAMVHVGGGQVLLFGGGSYAGYSDTWVYDLGANTWTNRSPATRPSARSWHAMALLGGDQVLLFGGQTGQETQNGETWIYDLSDNSWVQQSPAGSPYGRAGHTLVSFGAGQALLFGGMHGLDLLEEVWVYDVAAGTWTEQAPARGPSPRVGAAMDSMGGDQVLLFGGGTEEKMLDETWVYDVSDQAWTRKTPEARPEWRFWHALAYIGGDQVLLFGGYDGSNWFDDTWVYDLGDNTWTAKTPATAPAPRWGHRMAYLGGDQVLLFGGGEFAGPVADTWIYDLGDNTWTNMAPPAAHPSPRVDHGLASLGGGRVLLFGGYTSPGFSDETWIYELDTNTWTQKTPATSPSPRAMPGMASPGGDRVVLFGGEVGSEALGDTWVYDVSADTWANRALAAGPSARSFHAMASPGAGQVLLFGGGLNPYPPAANGETWLFDLNALPTAADDAYTTPQDTPLTVPAPGVLANDTDPDGDALTATLVSDVPAGTLDLAADGGFTYTPPAGYAGVVTFTYQADDGFDLSNVATVSITVEAPPVPVGPVVYAAHVVDDDNVDQSRGNGDGVAQCGETIELWVDLVNQGTDRANTVVGSLSTADPYVTWPGNTQSGYPNIAGGAVKRNYNDFEIVLAPGTPNGHVVHLELNVAASNGGPWTDALDLVVACGGAANQPPYTPGNLSPADGAVSQSVDVDLYWTGGDPDSGDTVTYDVYFEANDSTPDILWCSTLGGTACNPGTLAFSTTYYWLVVATDDWGASTTGPTWSFTTQASTPAVGPAVYQAHVIDDDNVDQSLGNGNGLVDCGETIELWVDLLNQGTDRANTVVGSLSTADPYVTWPGNTQSGYPNIPGGAAKRNYNDFEMSIAPDTPDGHVVTLNVNVTAANGGPWASTVNVVVACGGGENHPPYIPHSPSPADGATNQGVDVTLGWAGGDPDAGDTVTYDVYLAANDDTPDLLVCDDAATPACDPGTLAYGTLYYWAVVATDQDGASTAGPVWSLTTQGSPVAVGPVVYAAHVVDDDNVDQSRGNGDGIAQCGETIELWVDLLNQGTERADSVFSSLSTTSPYVTWAGNSSSGYPNIPGGAVRRNYNDFELVIAPDTPHGSVIHFTLSVTAANGGPWTGSFDLVVVCAP